MTTVERVRVAILGSGFAGLAMAAQLRAAGIDDFVVLERADAIGGVWRDNDYPGCACDVPAHLYSYSFAPNPGWSSAYAPQPEIRAYLERVVAERGLDRFVRLGVDVVAAVYDEADATWAVRAADGRSFVADVLVGATGGLSRPSRPRLPGLERFAGPHWHSAAWRHDVPLAGKRVAVVGTGASAIQLVPHVAATAARLHLFQRTPPWVLPRVDHDFSPTEQRLLGIPPLRWLYRARLYWRLESRVIPLTLAPGLMQLAKRLAIRHLHRQITDPALRRKLTPTYVMGCKRVLLSNTYYPALARPNVEVVTEPIREVTPAGIVTADGVERPLDAILFATGFDVHDYLGRLRIVGRGGADLGERWRRSAQAYLGTTVPEFPNLFVLIGPNTGLGHNSLIFMIESQVRYVVSCLRAMTAGDLASVEPRADVVERYNERLQARLERTVWMSGCESWYRDSTGRNTTLWPGSTAEFRLRTRRFAASDYVVRRRSELSATAARAAASTARALAGGR